ncbi:MAG: hypothetical protein JO182_06415 [Acidobacteriaceae bacterium]|nr:hypothetical protein [Acidobacteriaceae bacterium]
MPTLRRVTWMLLRADAKKLSASDQTFLTILRQQCPELAQAARAATEFIRIVRERDAVAWPVGGSKLE